MADAPEAAVSVTSDARPTLARSRRIEELDALRGIGSFALLAFHLWPGTFFFGWTRVDLFFVLSGYLITSIILRQLDQPRFLRRFWTRRALRIWPAYYILLVFVCVRASCQGNSPRLDALLEHLSFTQNVPYYWEGAVPGHPARRCQPRGRRQRPSVLRLQSTHPALAVHRMGRGKPGPRALRPRHRPQGAHQPRR